MNANESESKAYRKPLIATIPSAHLSEVLGPARTGSTSPTPYDPRFDERSPA